MSAEMQSQDEEALKERRRIDEFIEEHAQVLKTGKTGLRALGEMYFSWRNEKKKKKGKKLIEYTEAEAGLKGQQIFNQRHENDEHGSDTIFREPRVQRDYGGHKHNF